ncbi:MAG: hypothetical protein FIA96_17830 [Betaproteobacteria bacterium]|nr:hypothetical protein [Betaproteobacteria bacterium]
MYQVIELLPGMVALRRRHHGVDGHGEFRRGAAQGQRPCQPRRIGGQIEAGRVVAQQRDDAFARRAFALHLAHQFQQFALAAQPFLVPELVARILGFDHAPQGAFLLVAEAAEPIFGAFQQTLVARLVLRSLALREAHFLDEIGILLGEARGHAVDLGRCQGGHEIGDIRCGLLGDYPHAADQVIAEPQRIACRWLAGNKSLALLQQGNIVRQLGLAVPGKQTGQTLAAQRILLRRQIEVLVDPPARKAVRIAIAEAHGAAALQDQADDEGQDQVADETVHERRGAKRRDWSIHGHRGGSQSPTAGMAEAAPSEKAPGRAFCRTTVRCPKATDAIDKSEASSLTTLPPLAINIALQVPHAAIGIHSNPIRAFVATSTRHKIGTINSDTSDDQIIRFVHMGLVAQNYPVSVFMNKYCSWFEVLRIHGERQRVREHSMTRMSLMILTKLTCLCLGVLLVVPTMALAAEGGAAGNPPPAATQPNLILQLGHLEEINGMPALSPDGKLAATMDKGHTVIVWDVSTGRQLRRLIPNEEREVSWSKEKEKGSTTSFFPVQLAFSPDGTILAAPAEQGVTLWRVQDGRILQDIKLSKDFMVGETRALTFSPDGKRLAVSKTSYNGIAVLEVATGRVIYEPGSRSSNVFYTFDVMVWSPDGRFIFATHNFDCPPELAKNVDGWPVRTCVINVLDASTGKKIQAIEGDGSNNQHFALSPDGKLLAVYQASLRAYDSLDEAQKRALGSNPNLFKDIALGPDGKPVSGPRGNISFVREIRIALYEAGSWRQLATFPSGFGGRFTKPSILAFNFPTPLAFSPDGRWLAAGGETLKFWNIQNTALPAQELALPFPTNSYAWLPDGQSVLVFGRSGIPQILSLAPSSNLANWESISPLRYSGAGDSVAIDQDGLRLAVSSGLIGNKGLIDIWDIKAGVRSRRLESAGIGGIVRFSPDGTWLAHRRDGIEVWNTQTASRVVHIPNWGFANFELTADGRLLANTGNAIQLYDIPSGNKIAEYPGTKSGEKPPSFPRYAVSPDGRWIAAYQRGEKGIWNDFLRIWNTQSGQEVASFQVHGGTNLLQFINNRQLVYLGGDKPLDVIRQPLWVWNVERGKNDSPVGELPHTVIWNVSSLVGTRLALCCSTQTGEMSGLSKIFDFKTGQQWPLRDSRFVGGYLASMALFPAGRFIALAGTDGTVRVLTQDKGELVITLLAMPGTDDWLAFTPEGLFDGTPGGWDALLWRFSDELYDVAPAEAFFNEFYRPGLLADMMAGGRPSAPRSLASVDRRQPRVSLSVAGGSERQAKVRIDVQEAPPGGGRAGGSGVRDVRLFRNGSLVKLWKGEVNGGKGVLEATVPIVTGENRFTAYAFNRDNIKSGDARASVTGADSLKRPATAWVLAFGINRYANPAFNLGFSVADAQAFTERIKLDQTTLGRYQQIKLFTLKDNEATKTNLLTALKRLAGSERGPLPKGLPKELAELSPAQPEDAVFIFFAGHGMANGPRFYLVPHDLGYQGKMEQMDAKAMATIFQHAVSDLELEAALETLDAERLVLTIDACNSGQALEAEEKRRGPMNSKGLAQLAYEKGMYVITAAQSHQAALEFDQLGHGLLTYALVMEGLGKGEADRQPKDGRIDVREWLDYASGRVPQLQLAAMQDLEKRGRKVAVVRGEETEVDVLKRSLQQPRVFYRRETERTPFVVGTGK